MSAIRQRSPRCSKPASATYSSTAAEHDSVVLFPYQYIFGIASGRNVAGGVLQSFLAGGPYLSQFDIAGYQRAAAPAGLYFPGRRSEHCHRRSTQLHAHPGCLVLARSPLPIGARTIARDVWFAQGRLAIRADFAAATAADHRGRKAIRSASVARWWTSAIPCGPSTGADFLRLRLTARYGPLWKLRKPERLQLEITRADGSRDLQSFVVEPNVSSEVWFYPWNQADLAHYFDADERRLAHRPAPGDHSSSPAGHAVGLGFAAARVDRDRVRRRGAAEDEAVMASQPSSSAQRSVSSAAAFVASKTLGCAGPRAADARRCADAVVVAAHADATGTAINLIDDSWLLDTSFKASRGLWFGRDVAFTYGPLFQWLSSAPARWTRHLDGRYLR